MIVNNEELVQALKDKLHALEYAKSALQSISKVAGNLSDDKLMSATGPQDARYRGTLVCNARDIKTDRPDSWQMIEIVMLVMVAAQTAGFGPVELLAKCFDKLEINKARKWAPRNEQGFHSHVEGT